MKKHQTVVFLGDGMADEPIPELGMRTPLQAANTPNMDTIAREGQSGTLLTLPEGFPTSSDVANMSVLGCDLATELCGRGPLEIAAQGIPTGPDDVVFRVNLISVDGEGVLRDFSGGHPDQASVNEMIAQLNERLGSEKIHFYPGVSYRNLLVLSGPEFTPDVGWEKPDDNHGERVQDHLPRVKTPGSEKTVRVLLDLIRGAAEVLKGRTSNGIWPWSCGRVGAIHNLCERYGVKAAVVSAVDVINGLGRCLGMDVIPVEGATGYVDTNYEGKADAVLQALRDGYDFVYVHLEATDEVSHAQDLKLKMKVIEDFDKRLVGRVMAGAGKNVAYCVLPDHPVPLAIGRHTRVPVPVSVCMPGMAPDAVDKYDEVSALQGNIGHLKGSGLMDLLLK